MRPQLTIKTSSPLQKYIINHASSEEEMDTLRSHRDDLIDFLSDNLTVLDELEDRSGLSYKILDIDIWVITGRDVSISSPILIAHRDSTETEFFELIYMLAKELIYQNLPDLPEHKMLEPGYDRIDTTAGMLAYRSMARAMGEDFVTTALQDAPFTDDQQQTWDEVQDRIEDWDPDTSLLAHLGIEEPTRDDEKLSDIADSFQ